MIHGNVWKRNSDGTYSRPFRPPTNVVTPPGGGHAVAISNALAALSPGQTYTLPRGIYELDFRTHPQNGGYLVCILVPNGVTFDFSQAELRLKPGQPRNTEVVGGVTVTTAQESDIIGNTWLGGQSTPSRYSEDITIVVGCLNGQGNQQGNGDNQQGSDECWFNGIRLWNALNCTITGQRSPWSRRVAADRGDGQKVTVRTHGCIKNIRGWDGNGGSTEAFSYDFMNPRTGNVAEHLETMRDDGSTRGSTGGSSNQQFAGSVSVPRVTHDNIWGHHLKSQGATSWGTERVARTNSLFEDNTGSGYRYEYGWTHTATDIVSRNNVNNGLNLKGEETPPGGTTMLVTTRCSFLDNTNHSVQLNSIVGATLSGWERHPSGKQKVDFNDALYGGRDSTGVVYTNLTTVA